MKHTPGPWFDISDDAKGRPNMPRMAMVSTSYAGSRQAIDCTGSGENYAQDCANARLIAAAPELLGALKACLSRTSMSDLLRAEVDAAIAKAEGA